MASAFVDIAETVAPPRITRSVDLFMSRNLLQTDCYFCQSEVVMKLECGHLIWQSGTRTPRKSVRCVPCWWDGVE